MLPNVQFESNTDEMPVNLSYSYFLVLITALYGILPALLTRGTRPGVDPDPQLQCVVWFVLDLEASNFVEQVQGRVCHFGRVAAPVTVRKTARQHVSITNRFHLSIIG